jgi:hypothetical protein
MPEAYGRGIQYEPPAESTLDRRMREADLPGRHLWVMTGVWQVRDPFAATTNPGPVMLDAENLVGLVGPGCFKCERPYDPRLARKVCRGSIH